MFDVARPALHCYGPGLSQASYRRKERSLVVGVARVVLALGQSHSLKEKRAVVRKVIDRVRARFTVAIAEVDDHDKWQKATLGLSAVGAETHHVRSMLEEVLRAIEEFYVAPVVHTDLQVTGWNDFDTNSLEAAAGQGPNPFTRELLAGEGEDDDEPEDAPWALPDEPSQTATSPRRR